MAVEQTEAVSTPTHAAPTHPASHVPPRPAPASPPPSRGGSPVWRWLLGIFAIAVIGALGFYFYMHQGQPTKAKPDEEARKAAAEGATPVVETVTPTAGGLVRQTTQPGTVHAFQAADLMAKIPGYLKTQTVDIGDRVTQGQLLVEIDDPEAHKEVELSEASLKQAQAAVKQAQASVDTAEADVLASKAELAKSQADVKEFEAERVYRQSELDRYIRLARDRSIEEKLVDEERERLAAATASENAAKAAVESSRAKVVSAQARVEQARADLAAAEANVAVSQAGLDKAKVIADYTTIRAPFDGVITQRNFFVGDFIRSAADGDPRPLLSISRTDKLRVVVRIPDRDVPFVDRGDKARITIDALPGEEIDAEVWRFAESEDPTDRTMRTEILLENKDDRLREGMYGSVTVILQAASEGAVTIPSNALIQQDGSGNGAVYVVRADKVEKRDVKVGKDNGKNVEVLEGLTTSDSVIVRYSGSISPGLAVKSEAYKDPGAKKEEG